MVLWPIYLIAIISTVGCIILWFRDVRRVMREQESTVESAHRELAVWRDKAQKAQGAPESVAICERCEDVYQQAVAIYNRTMQKPFHYVPAYLMGFRIKQEGTSGPAFYTVGPGVPANREENQH